MISDVLGRRPVGADDATFLRGLFVSTRPDLDALPLPPPQAEALVDLQQRAQQREYEQRCPAAEHSVLVHDGQDVGRVWVDRDDERIQLLDLTIDPGWQGRGLGRSVLEELQREATRLLVSLRLSVRRDNPRAHRLYVRLGFVEVGGDDVLVAMEWRPADQSAREKTTS